jgi:hypothetical protein
MVEVSSPLIINSNLQLAKNQSVRPTLFADGQGERLALLAETAGERLSS